MEGAYTDERLWMDKYQPKNLGELDFNHNITNILKTIAQKEDFPHLIFYGPEGAGKKTRIKAFLSQVYNSGVYKVNTEMKEVKVNSASVEYLITSSNYHLELTPSDAEIYDRVIIQKVIKEAASSAVFDNKSSKKFKVIVLHEIDNLTREAQAALRRTMEKYTQSCRLIMSCNSLTKIIPPIRSRCLSLRVPCASESDIKTILTNIKLSESVNVSDKQLELIVQSSDRNIRRAVNCLQLSKIISNFYLATLEMYSKEIFIPEYIKAIKQICLEVVKDQSATNLKALREPVLKLLINGVPSDAIILNMVRELCAMKFAEETKRQFVHWASFYDNRLQNGSKALFHMEALLARFMYIASEGK